MEGLELREDRVQGSELHWNVVSRVNSHKCLNRIHKRTVVNERGLDDHGIVRIIVMPPKIIVETLARRFSCLARYWRNSPEYAALILRRVCKCARLIDVVAQST